MEIRDDIIHLLQFLAIIWQVYASYRIVKTVTLPVVELFTNKERLEDDS